MEGDPVELGVDLLRHCEESTLQMAEAVSRLEAITTDPHLTRKILDEADRRGVIDRDEGIIQTKSRAFIRFDSDVIKKEGSFKCRRCGANLTTGHFIKFNSGELGPFGSSCIRKVTGRDSS
ncbi:MAG: DUF5830 family protein [Halobacteriales archaeon]|nr:DUF5830 family protein [Halobacteriales archaeon]